MPKKRNHLPYHKPASTAHPSLSPASTPNQTSSGGKQSSPSVNELLARLRKSQTSSGSDVVNSTGQPAANNPLLTTSNGSGSRPTAPGMLAPRAHPGVQNRQRTPRRPPGPAPPPSWLVSANDQAQASTSNSGNNSMAFERPYSVDRLPGRVTPSEKSLQHMALVTLVKDWRWQAYYNQHHLVFLPPRLKSLLLSYIAVYGQTGGPTVEDLHTLFDTWEEDGLTEDDDVTHLDLSGVVARSISLKQLQHFLVAQSSSIVEAPSTSVSNLSLKDGDSWEASTPDFLSTPKTMPFVRFPNLTHLSLSHPGPGASWSGLLSLAPHLATLTHLSLAYWPAPCLTPNAKTASAVPKNLPFSVSYGGTDFYSTYEGDWSEAAGILRRLSKATYCLKWLDLEGCHEWMEALAWGSDDLHRGKGAEWTEAWKGVETVIMRQRKSTVDQRGEDLIFANELAVRRRILTRRTEARCPWVDFVLSWSTTKDFSMWEPLSIFLKVSPPVTVDVCYRRV